MSPIPPRTSGIYQICCLPTGKIYVSSAVNLQARWDSIRKLLGDGCFVNEYLQHDWVQYGEENFNFSILELMDESELLQAEQAWRDRLNGAKIHVRTRDEPPSEIPALVWEGFIDPDGKQVAIINLQKFCLAHKLKYPSMCRLAMGTNKLKFHRGWTHHKMHEGGYRPRIYSGFINPEGQRVTATNLTEFCRQNYLRPDKITELINGERRIHKGWTWREDNE